MASSQSEAGQEVAQRQKIFADYTRFLSTSTLAACVLAPVLIALPPRKLDLFTFSLTGVFIASVDYQAKERTGLGLVERTSRRFLSSREPLAGATQDDTSAIRKGDRELVEQSSSNLVPGGPRSSSLQHQAQQDWKQLRLKEEQEKLDQGEGYGSMIMDQIWGVWNQEEKKMEQIKEKDEEVVQNRKEQG